MKNIMWATRSAEIQKIGFFDEGNMINILAGNHQKIPLDSGLECEFEKHP